MATLEMNTHILAHEFDLLEAHSVEEAVALLARHGGQAKILAGGTDLLVQMKMERVKPPIVIWIGKIDALRQIREHEGLSLGALVSLYELQKSVAVKEGYPVLHEAARSVSGTQIKVMGTVGGNLCNASPASDSAPALLVLGGQVKLVSSRGARQVRLEEFFLGPGKTVLAPDELLTEVLLPLPVGGSAFLKIGRVAADLAKVSAAAWVRREGGTVADCRIALGSVAATPVRARQAEKALIGRPFSPALAEEAGRLVRGEIKPIDDIRSTAEYRLQVAGVLVRDALLAAWERCSGGVMRHG